ncbi:MAG: lipoprotein [Pusillimonas sp.]|jgi:hypothetical protein|nr:lipoprotein [Pusillimonas sp.]|tara:strand:+ start:39642 stop:39911 length:270 start_codon:yes stop_codon:yes gene_type:complete
MKQDFNHTDTRPWWKEPWPWILMAGPFITLVGCAVTIVLAVHYYSDQAIHDGGQRKGLVVQKIQDAPLPEMDAKNTSAETAAHNRRQSP